MSDATAASATGSDAPPTDAGHSHEPTRVLLLRHAVTAETGPKLTGRARGVDLSDVGRDQAAALSSRLAVVPLAAVYASPIERTTQTATAVAEAHGLPVLACPAVIEADYGEWTGGKLADLAKTPEWKTVQHQPSRAAFPGGETLRSMQSRVVSGIETVVADHPGQTVAVVSHADPIKAAIAHFAGMHLDLFQRIHVSPASVSVLEFHALVTMLVKLNDTGTLDDLVPATSRDEGGES